MIELALPGANVVHKVGLNALGAKDGLDLGPVVDGMVVELEGNVEGGASPRAAIVADVGEGLGEFGIGVGLDVAQPRSQTTFPSGLQFGQAVGGIPPAHGGCIGILLDAGHPFELGVGKVAHKTDGFGRFGYEGDLADQLAVSVVVKREGVEEVLLHFHGSNLVSGWEFDKCA